MELLSQLASDTDARAAFAALHAFPNIHNAKASGMLPWSDTLFRVSIFGLPIITDEVIPSLNNAVNDVLNATDVQSMRKLGEHFRAMLDEAKLQKVEEFSDLMKVWRSGGGMSEKEHRQIFAHSIARSAKAEVANADVDFIVGKLNALYLFDKNKITRAAKDKNYNPQKWANDLYDAEFLVYLADPGLHFLTSDKGFRKTEGAAQYPRINIVHPNALLDLATATATLQKIIEQWS